VKLIGALIRLRREDRNAIASIPAPKDDRDTAVIFVLGSAHLSFGDYEAAAQQLKRIDTRPGLTLNVLATLGRLGYGRALAKLGKRDESGEVYDRILTIWKNADSRLPVLMSTRLEYEKLLKP